MSRAELLWYNLGRDVARTATRQARRWDGYELPSLDELTGEEKQGLADLGAEKCYSWLLRGAADFDAGR